MQVNQTVLNEVMVAYADCNHLKSGRCLDFSASQQVTLEEARYILMAAIPSGYNEFDPDLTLKDMIELFGATAKVLIAREGSVCLYLDLETADPTHNGLKGHFIAKMLKADEATDADIADGTMRIWWD